MKRINITVFYDETQISASAIEKHVWLLRDEVEGMASGEPLDSAATADDDGLKVPDDEHPYYFGRPAPSGASR